MKYLLVTLFSCVLFFACDKDEKISDDVFTFGAYAGECFGNCATLYQLTETELFADNVEYFNLDFEELEFSSIPMEDSKFQLAKDFYNEIPTELSESDSNTFGTPDAYDQGGYFMAITGPDTFKTWYIDTNKEVLPDYLKTYVEKLEVLMPQL